MQENPIEYPHPTEIIPHRSPFLFLDEVTEIIPGNSARGLWHLRPEADFFAGHFPGRPIVPGVLQIEALAQLGAYCLLTNEEFEGKLPLFAGIEKARFKKQILPGDTAELIIELDSLRAMAGKGHGEIRIDGSRAMSASLLFVFVNS